LYRYETWSLKLGQGHRLKIFKNRKLRRIFGPKREEVAGEWGRLHNEELCKLYTSLNLLRVIKSRKVRWMGNVARMGAMRNIYNILVGKLEGKRPLGKSKHRWEDNIVGRYGLDACGSE
jgi:hypothetical protein